MLVVNSNQLCLAHVTDRCDEECNCMEYYDLEFWVILVVGAGAGAILGILFGILFHYCWRRW